MVEKIFRLVSNAAFWIFIAGMGCSIFKPLQLFAVFCLLLSIPLFLISVIGLLILKLINRNKKNGIQAPE
jgi:hypothetical protein